LASFGGAGWNCTGVGTANVACTNNSGLNSGASLPALTLTVDVGAGTPVGPNSITNTATVSTTPPQELNTGNNSASDPTNVVNFAKADTTTAMASSANPAVFGQSASFTATVTGGAIPLTGSVEFFDGATSLGTSPLSGGSAMLSTSALAVATHSITAVYGG